MKPFVGLAGISTCLIMFWSCTKETQTTQATQEILPVTQPIIIDTTYTQEYVASIASLQNVEVRSKNGGYVEAVLVDEGKPVRAGQTLFRLGSQAYRQALNKAQAILRSSQAEAKTLTLEIKNTRFLVEQNVVSKSELDLVESKLETLKAKIEETESDVANAQLQLSLTEIKAPFSGVIGRIPNKTGSLVDEGTLLTTLSNNQDVFAYFNVTEKEYLDFTEQNEVGRRRPVKLLLANGQPYSQTGVIETVDSQFDKSTGTIAFRARFPNPKQVLKNGASGKVQLTNSLKNALIIPQKSVFEVQDRNCVYVLDAENKVSQRDVQITQRLPQLYVIGAGLTTKDKVLYEGIQRVVDGDFVSPKLMPMRQVMASMGQK